MKVIYVLPVKGGGGGAHSVAQEVNELIRFGADAYIAVNEANAPYFAGNYADLHYLENHILAFNNHYDLSLLLEDCDLVVCTVFTSVQLVKSAMDVIVGSKPKVAYYIQDYEPLFCTPGDALHATAVSSYTDIPGTLLFAKTHWIRDIVSKNHDRDVQKVMPSLDTSLYYPAARQVTESIQVSAMVRPSTPRRAPLRTMTVLKDVSERYGDKVNINIFGCSDLDIHSNQLPSDFNYTNHGILSRKQVSTLLRSSHLFLDLSDYQAFGRTGLEAMACGCVPMLPVFGGAHEYATHLQNALLVDTRSKKDILENMELFVNLNAAERNRLSDAGIRTSQQYSIGRAAYSKFQIFRDHIAA